jgi:hypothetical protein
VKSLHGPRRRMRESVSNATTSVCEQCGKVKHDDEFESEDLPEMKMCWRPTKDGERLFSLHILVFFG